MEARQVVVVGVGALGSHVVQLLRSENVNIRVIDFDRIERKNLTSQFYGLPSLGKNKAEALKQAMQFNWGLKVESVPHKLTANNADELLTDVALIIDCLDNGASRRLIQDWCRGFNDYAATMDPRQNIACLHGALAPGGDFGQVIWDERFKIDDEAGAGATTCEGGEFLPFIGVVSAYIARAAQLFLKDGVKIGYVIHPGGAARV